jgi:hypothetical protein
MSQTVVAESRAIFSPDFNSDDPHQIVPELRDYAVFRNIGPVVVWLFLNRIKPAV